MDGQEVLRCEMQRATVCRGDASQQTGKAHLTVYYLKEGFLPVRSLRIDSTESTA